MELARLQVLLDRSVQNSRPQFRTRLICDIKAYDVVAKWKPPSQKVDRMDRRFAFALSPDGELLSEGDLGFVRLYRIKVNN